MYFLAKSTIYVYAWHAYISRKVILFTDGKCESYLIENDIITFVFGT